MQTGNLQAFITVAEQGSFSRAAELLFLTQSAVSKRISNLESEFACTLFDRIGHRVTLTEAGRLLLPKAQSITNQVMDCQKAICNLSQHIAGKLTLGTSHHIGLHHLPEILKKYTLQYPDVELDLHFMDSESICSAVIQGKLDLGIATLPAPPTELITMTIWNDSLQFTCSHSHPLATNDQLSIEELSHHPAILPPKESETYKILASLFKSNGYKLKTTMATNNLETIKMMVSIGLGWSLLPSTMKDNSTKKLRVNKVKLKRTLGSVVNRDRTLSNAATKLIELLVIEKNRHSNNQRNLIKCIQHA